ncbi:MAG: penicillin-binding protein 1A [Desulfohalobiaceae bacterium]
MKRLVKYFLLLVLLLVVLGVGAGAGLYFWAAKDLPRMKEITDYNPALTTTVYARDGQVLGYLSKENRFLVSLYEMDPRLPLAFMASEDSSFYEHEGVDFFSILRAFVRNLQAGSIVQGGSTITQQVIKSLLLSPERSYTRKLKEAILAYRLENNLHKDEILTIYMNQIYMGHGAYGVEAAARTYFGKHSSGLNLAEAALLAGLPKAPSAYNPYKHPQRAKARQKYVLDRMLNKDWITQEQHQEALQQELNYQPMLDPSWQTGAYYLEEVRRWLLDRFGEKKTYTGGLEVQTAVDLEHQRAAHEALRQGLEDSTKRRGWQGPIQSLKQHEYSSFLQEQKQEQGQKAMRKLRAGDWIQALVTEVEKQGAEVKFASEEAWMDVSSMSWCREPNPEKAPEDVRDIQDARQVLESGDVVWASLASEDEEGQDLELALEQKPRVQGALFSMDPETGEVRALQGGYSFQESQFNRATQSERQTGSAFKPIVYSAALDHGFTPASVLMDAPVVYAGGGADSAWKPENYERTSFGPTLLRTALVKSRNLVTIRVARELGIENVIQRAKQMGLRDTEYPRELSVSLGTASTSLLELCRAYGVLARGGSLVEPRLVLQVRDSWEEELYQSEKQVQQAISPRTAYIITHLLQQVVQDGTGWRAKALGRPVAGKTGTTDEQKDAWFLGYAPYLMTGVYVGFDDPKPMGKYETGSRAAVPIWLGYRQQVEDSYPVQDFTRPPGIVMARVDAENGLLAASGSEDSYLLPFKAGTQPTRLSRGGNDRQKARQDGEQEDSQGDGDVLKSLF